MWSLLPLLLAPLDGPELTPYFQREPASIQGASVVGKASQGSVVELEVDAHATYNDPFDPDDVSLDAKVTPPSGDAYTVPGFYMREYRLSGDDVTPADDKGWRVRFYPPVSGTYRIDLTLKDENNAATHSTTVAVTDAAGAKGMVRLSPRDRRYFETNDGKAFYPIGSNVAWAGNRALGAYESWFPKYGAQGANWARVWLSPAWTTFALEVAGKPAEGKGLGQFDQRDAARLDEALTLARRNGIYLQLCIDSYNILRDRDAANFWEQTPHNRENGGPLRIWSDFWTNPKMDKLYKGKLRYLVARYSANPNVFSWEFWNEVDLTRNYDLEVVRSWHERMGNALRAMDPYHHLVSTSVSNPMGERSLAMLPQLDYIQTHYYGPDPGGQTAYQQTRKGQWGKAHIVAEVGADAAGARATEDRRGIQIHDPIWASIATGASGTAMPWYWDNYVDPLNLYPLFGAASRFVEGIDWPGEDFRQSRPTLTYANPPATPRMKDAVLSGGPVSWDYSAANRPSIVRYAGGHFRGNLPLSGIQHGIVNHGNLHNPVEFFLALPKKTRFVVEVGNVSGYGGAKLQVTLDGARVMTREFADPDGETKTDDLTKYAGAYGIDIAPGNHVVTVENVGNDWFMVSYRLLGVVAAKNPPLVGYAVTGEHTAIVWLRSEDATWRNEVAMRHKPTPSPSTVLRLPGLSSGSWTVEHWNTWTGVRTRSQVVGVGINGVLRVQIPAIDRDLALKIRKN